MSGTTRTIRHSRRAVLAGATALAGQALASRILPAPALAANPGLLTRPIPASGEQIPQLGMGTWITFNVGADEALRAQRAEVLRTFFEAGGAMVDSSPMYGSAEEVVGDCLKRIGGRERLFSATKVWTVSKWLGVSQMEESEELWGENQFDLMQIHNLLDWEAHMETLTDWKANGRLRYTGITTSHGRRHEELAEIIVRQPFDFIQLTYNVRDREVEERLLPLAMDNGRAVIVNRPFRRGELPQQLEKHPLPGWAAEIGCTTWAQVLLKFVISHPAVTCAIPATSRVEHMRENMAACRGPLPDAALRKRMITDIEAL
ncbi:aldo/keto reductase [Denitrobaculum tricleocarpae]|uniref:Aldo/keto reductase n=1 Tax=Denitrobaculum tricleocarpae TaxID=2591009 RepID=A0A545T276_9PROT|nr:aldo/keto reductase [Denitrobaculum tricleocarpae]TQV71303.1 aldo/keto reductase [Denitrobaculum tricleocarpae]